MTPKTLKIKLEHQTRYIELLERENQKMAFILKEDYKPNLNDLDEGIFLKEILRILK